LAKSKEKSLITSKTKEKESKNAEIKEKPDDVKDKRENRLQHRHKTQQNEELIQESEISKGTYIILNFSNTDVATDPEGISRTTGCPQRGARTAENAL